MDILNKARIEFEESMSGHIGKGQTDPRKGYEVGKRQETDVRFDVRIRIDDLSRFLKISHHEATLTGTVTSELFGGTHEISDGIFNLFSLNPTTGIREMVYAFKFTADGQTYYLHGHKFAGDCNKVCHQGRRREGVQGGDRRAVEDDAGRSLR